MAGKSDDQSTSPPVKPSARDTAMPRETSTPVEDDALWEQLGSTHITDGKNGAASGSSNITSPANFTEMSPSVILGKNLTTLGDFKLLRKLGEGAMGAVYKAEQISFNRIVALKVLFPHVANIPKLVARLEREAKVMFELDHPNIVKSYAYDHTNGFHLVAMEFIDGRSLQKWLTQLGRVPVGDAVGVILECCKALAYAHSLNMVHRDIKPDNILLTKKGAVKVADLGMVKVDDEEMSLTQTGHAVGTPWFMPLEQARNAKEIDGRSDIYALGCTLYALLTGRPPFIGRTIVEVIQAKEAGTFSPARQANSDVPERLDLIIAKMTAKLPKNRYQSCEEVAKDLESLNLASATLTFVQAKPVDTPVPAESFEELAKTNVTAPQKSRADIDYAASAAAPLLDPNQWYVQLVMPDGSLATRKYTTAQLNKMLADGTMKPNALASHTASEGFRKLGTYKEFQGAALTTLTKKAADKNTARTRGELKRIEEEVSRREEKEKKSQVEETEMQANVRYWGGFFLKIILPIGAAIIGVVALLKYFASMF
jgi:serine/threonine-protein kinase